MSCDTQGDLVPDTAGIVSSFCPSSDDGNDDVVVLDDKWQWQQAV